MRIVGGVHKGSKLHTPKTSATRPISDRAKEALFNILGDIEGLTLVDLYAGSGSVGLEALSRGASKVVFVDSQEIAIETIKKNVERLKFSAQVQIEKKPVALWLLENHEPFDIVFADPPFSESEEIDYVRLAELANRLFIYKHPRRHKPQSIAGFELVRSRRYGDSALSIYLR